MKITKEFILNELNKVTKYKFLGDSVSICCPFHLEKEPSLHIALTDKKVPIGTFHCFGIGCNAKGNWNVLAEKLGLTKIVNGEKENRYSLRNDIYLSDKLEIFSPKMEEDLVLLDLKNGWRKYDKSFLDKFGAKLLWEEKYSDYYLYLPVTFLGEYSGHIRCKINPKSPGTKYWFNLQTKPLYPFDIFLDKKCTTVILVEGVADAFRLIKHGMIAQATLGNSEPKKIKSYLDLQMTKRVIICFDGDEAGETAAVKIAQYLEKYFDVRIFTPPRNRDPDDMPKVYVKALKTLYKRLKGQII